MIPKSEDTSEARKPKSFEALTPELSSWILDYTRSMNFVRTTPVQAMAIPLLMGNKDLVVEAVTGSGKTLAFLIPIVERLLKGDEPNKKGHVRSIIIAPTKELATQIYDVLCGLLEFHSPSAARLRPPIDEDDMTATGDADDADLRSRPGVVPQLLTGGRSKLQEDLAKFSELNPNVLVGTPKRLVEVLRSSKVILKRHIFDLLILDEADRLLDANFHGDLQNILELIPKERRTGLFSATVSEAVNELIRVGMRYPFKISAKVRSRTGALDKRTPESLKMAYVAVKPTHKLPILKRILGIRQVEKSIVYVSTRAGVDYWSHVLPSVLGVTILPLHGDYKADIRAKNLRKFRDSTMPAMLLTTDVLARGIDIPDIDLVVQLDPPAQPKDYVHRCGRSGRAGKKGFALSFLAEGSEEDYIRYLEVQGTTVEAYPSPPAVDEQEVNDMVAKIRDILLQKREFHDRSQKAFVSWVQAYTKTLPSDIFNIKNVDWAQTGKAWGLLRWPKMPELKRHFPEGVQDRKANLDLPAGFDLDRLKYLDKIREDNRQAFMQVKARGEKPERIGSTGGAAADIRRRREKAWSGQKEAKALRETRRERKLVRRQAEKSSKMSEDQRAQAVELNDLIAKVREQNANRHDDETFEGFAD